MKSPVTPRRLSGSNYTADLSGPKNTGKEDDGGENEDDEDEKRKMKVMSKKMKRKN